MVRTNIPAGFCTYCRGQLFVGMQFCSDCGKPVVTNTRVIPEVDLITPPVKKIPIPAKPLSNAPTPPKSITNPTNEQIQLAAISNTNPYASWGELVLGGSRNKIIQENYEEEDETPSKYYGGVFRQYCERWPHPPFSWDYNPQINMLQGGPFESFAFQALLRRSSEEARGGLVFLSDEKGEVFYAFVIYENNPHSSEVEAREYSFAVKNERGQLIHEAASNVIRGIETNLLGVVVQEPGILDLYINLVHVHHMYDGSLMQGGFLGFCAFEDEIVVGGEQYIYITQPKVWIKNNPFT